MDEAKEMQDQAEHEKERKREGGKSSIVFLGKERGVREWGRGSRPKKVMHALLHFSSAPPPFFFVFFINI